MSDSLQKLPSKILSSKDLFFVVLQFLREEKFTETAHKFEQESGLYFDFKYLEELVLDGKWDEAEKYLFGFANFDSDRYSMKIFFDIRKTKYLEAVYRGDRTKALEILMNDLREFSKYNEDIYKQCTELLTVDNIREHKQLSSYKDTKHVRNVLLSELKTSINSTPLFQGKLQFPSFKNSRLRTLFKQSVLWQHELCKNPKPSPDIRTVLTDHTCAQQSVQLAPKPFQAHPDPLLYSLASLLPDSRASAILSLAETDRMMLGNQMEQSWPTGEILEENVEIQGLVDGKSRVVVEANTESNLKSRVEKDAMNKGNGISKMAKKLHSLSPRDNMPVTKNVEIQGLGDGRSSVVVKTKTESNLKSRVVKDAKTNVESHGLGDGKSREVGEKNEGDGKPKDGKSWVAEECRSLRLLDNFPVSKISRLMYTNSGDSILALTSSAVHKFWRWPNDDSGRESSNITPQLWQLKCGILMTNKIGDTNPEEVVHCFAISKNDTYLMSASGGEISLFHMIAFKTMTTFLPPPPAATFLAFHPRDNNIMVIGMEDGSIQIYYIRFDEVKRKLRGHQKRITGLAFSTVHDVLVSSGSDAQLILWSMDVWKRKISKLLPLRIHSQKVSSSLSDTQVQFHQDQTHFLVVHEHLIAIYECINLDCKYEWKPKEASTILRHATYSCDGEKVYVCLSDGSISVLCGLTLGHRHRVGPSAYLPPDLSSRVYPVTVAAHPSEPAQFAVGLTDGGVVVLEPSNFPDWPSLPSPSPEDSSDYFNQPPVLEEDLADYTSTRKIGSSHMP